VCAKGVAYANGACASVPVNTTANAIACNFTRRDGAGRKVICERNSGDLFVCQFRVRDVKDGTGKPVDEIRVVPARGVLAD